MTEAPSTSVYSAPAAESAYESAARKNLVSLQIVGVASSLSLTTDGTKNSESASLYGASAGLSVGLMIMIAEKASAEGNFGLFEKKYDSVRAEGGSYKFEGDGSIKISTLRFTGMGRYHLVPNVSIGLGGYYSRFGKVTETNEFGEQDQHPVDSRYRYDFGAAIGMRGELPISASFSFVGDARYFHGLRNLANQESRDTAQVKTRDIEVAVGAGFLF